MGEFGRVTSINERYWAALYAHENRVLFDPDEKTFYRYAADTGLWEPITPESIREAISPRILECSRVQKAFTLETQITQTRLNAVVSALKGIVERRGAFKSKQRYTRPATKRSLVSGVPQAPNLLRIGNLFKLTPNLWLL